MVAGFRGKNQLLLVFDNICLSNTIWGDKKTDAVVGQNRAGLWAVEQFFGFGQLQAERRQNLSLCALPARIPLLDP